MFGRKLDARRHVSRGASRCATACLADASDAICAGGSRHPAGRANTIPSASPDSVSIRPQTSPAKERVMRSARLSVIAIVCLCAAAAAAGQSFQGGLRGTVKDPQGVIPGATVSLTDQGTGVVRDTVSNDAGEYSFPGVVPGVYTVRASV